MRFDTRNAHPRDGRRVDGGNLGRVDGWDYGRVDRRVDRRVAADATA
ncbi:hypothetical protein GCM10027184_23730 [Saccharothrix stipae]